MRIRLVLVVLAKADAPGFLETLTNAHVVLGALFVALGAFAFYVSTLVSGQNLFRETSPTLATLVATAIGAMLFVLSPACFLLLEPRLFPLDLPAGTDSHSLPYWSAYVEKLVEFAWPYLTSAVGAGLVLGSLATLRARSAVWKWVQKGPGLRFPIRTYEPTWDTLLRRVKSGGTVHVWLVNGRHFRGSAANYSVGAEDRALLLGDCVELEPSLTDPAGVVRSPPAKVLFTHEAQIARVEVPSASLKRHEDMLSHAAQSFFVSLTNVGLLLLAHASWRTSKLLEEYAALAEVYRVLSWIVLVACGLLFLLAISLLHKDYRSFRAALALAPISASALAVLLLIPLVWASPSFGDSRLHDRPTLAPALDMPLVAAGVLFLAYVWGRWFTAKAELRERLLDRWWGSGHRRFAQRFCEEFDLAEPPALEYGRLRYELRNEPGAPEFFTELEKVFKELRLPLAEPYALLESFISQLRNERLRPPETR